MSVYIRRFQESDTAAVYDLVSSTLDEVYDPDVFTIVPNIWPRGSIVSETESGIVGFLMGSIKSPGHAQILMLSVNPDVRNLGIGSALMISFLAECYALNCLSVELEVRKSNISAIRFYQKFGFKLKELKEHYYHDGEDAFTMTIEES